MKTFGIHWFRRDLRLDNNRALKRNFEKHSGRVLAIFCFDSKFLAREDFSHNRFAFFLETLRSLKRDLQSHGGDLLVVNAQPDEVFKQVLSGVIKPTTVSFNRDYEPFARERDNRISKILKETQTEMLHERDHLVIEPREISKATDLQDYYKVYTPFSRRWREMMSSPTFNSRLLNEPFEGKFNYSWSEFKKESVDFNYTDALDEFIELNRRHVTIEIPEAGAIAARKTLEEFLPKLQRYSTDRDIPSLKGTSRLSMYFKNGSITPAEVLSRVYEYTKLDSTKFDITKFENEIIWREFYYSILWREPRVENEAFLTKYKDISWQNSSKLFECWKNGETGFPIVDAGMRELNSTGWMHNRVRMIVASFLTKDLLIDWRWGERYFMQKLLDGDLACNNGGWQWAASTGCDPQPYFRIFNPYLQSEKFDSDGEYIRRYVPELKALNKKQIHMPPEGLVKNYPAPVVNHAEQRMKAIKLFSEP